LVLSTALAYYHAPMSDALLGYYRAMARNNAWSNHRLLAACRALTQAELEARRVSFFPSRRCSSPSPSQKAMRRRSTADCAACSASENGRGRPASASR
jgi:hypothetical protein